jgi:hypothetical protein
MGRKTECKSCNAPIMANKTGLCIDCYKKSPKQREQYEKMQFNNIKRRHERKTFSDWKILRDKNQLIVDIECKVSDHQAFVYKILAERIKEVKEDFQRKSFTYWKLNEIITFLDDYSEKHSPQSDRKAPKSKL